MRPIRPIVLLFLSASLLAACGVPTPASSGGSRTRTIISVPTGSALGDLARNHLGGTAFDDGRGGDLLHRARRLVETAPGFEAEFVARAFGAFKSGIELEASREVMARYTMAWARPSLLRADVTDSTEGDLTGARITTTDSLTFTIRAPGLLGAFPRKISAEDPRLRNDRGHSLKVVCPDAQVARLAGTSAVWTVIGEGRTPAGQPTVRISVEGVPRLDADIDREELELETGSLALYQVAAYVGMRRVLGYDFTSFRWTRPEAASLGL